MKQRDIRRKQRVREMLHDKQTAAVLALQQELANALAELRQAQALRPVVAVKGGGKKKVDTPEYVAALQRYTSLKAKVDRLNLEPWKTDGPAPYTFDTAAGTTVVYP